jgi:hypothetical protein
MRRGTPPLTLDGLLYGAGDAVIGINPVSDNLGDRGVDHMGGRSARARHPYAVVR